jgi:hypothetical protein
MEGSNGGANVIADVTKGGNYKITKSLRKYYGCKNLTLRGRR